MIRTVATIALAATCLLGFSPMAWGAGKGDDCYTVATWNLEYYSFSRKRGFPENTGSGPTYCPRNASQREAIAVAMRARINARIVVLNEIDGKEVQNGVTIIEDLVKRLGSSWKSRIGMEGRIQRIAVVWDSRFARLNAYKEITIKEFRVNGKDIFERDPLLAHFTLLKDGESMNDLLVVGLHLASGQDRVRNHDAAMARLRTELKALRGNDPVLPGSEADILIAGDLNANAFDQHVEEFFEDFDQGDWRVLAKEGSYPATRLADVPLNYGDPIDYILATAKSNEYGGLLGEEVLEAEAKVWTDLIENGDFAKFREVYSDHLPVSVCVRLMTDTD